MAKKQRPKAKYLFLKTIVFLLILAVIYVSVVSLIPIDQITNEYLLNFVMGAIKAKQELSDNFQLYLLLITFVSILIVPSYLYLRNKK